MSRMLASMLLGTLLTSAPARAGIVDRDEEFHDAISGVSRAAHDPVSTIEDVNEKAYHAFGRPNAIKIRFAAHLRGWEFLAPAPAAEMTIANLIYDARSRLASRHAVLSGPLQESLETADQFDGAGRGEFAALGPSEAGMFLYKANNPDPGRILLNTAFHAMEEDCDKEIVPEQRSALRALVWVMAEATLIHEAAHAVAKKVNQLFPTEVINGEVFAFALEREFLRAIDPRLEGVAALLNVDKLHARDHASSTARVIDKLSEQIGNLQRTDGTRSKIQENVIVPAGYREYTGTI